MFRRRDFIRIAGLSGLMLYLESALPAFGKLIANKSEDIENLHRALSIAKRIEDKAYRARALCQVATGFYKLGKTAVADSLAEEALEISMKAINSELYTVGEYYLITDNLKGVINVIEIMDREDILVNVFEKTRLILSSSYYAYKKGDIALSDSFLYRFICSGVYTSMTPLGWEETPERTHLEWLERAYRMTNGHLRAEKILATQWFKAGDSVRGCRYLEYLWDSSPTSAVEIAISFFPEDKIKAIEERVFGIEDENYRVEALLRISDHYLKTDKERALKIIEKIIEIMGDGLSSETCGKIGSLLVRAGCVDKGKEYLYSVPALILKELSYKHEDDLPPIPTFTLSEWIDELIIAGLIDELPHLLSDLDKKDIIYEEPLLYSGIMYMAEQVNCRSNALSFLEGEIKRVSKKALPERINCLSKIAHAFIVYDEKEKGLEIAKNLIRQTGLVLKNRNSKRKIDFTYMSAVPNNKKDHDETIINSMLELSSALALYDDMIDEARTIADMLGDAALCDEVFEWRAYHLSEAERFKEALKTIFKIKDEKTRVTCMYYLVYRMVLQIQKENTCEKECYILSRIYS